MFDANSFFDDYGIEVASEDHKHSRPGWINVECPRCSGNPGYHLGFSEKTGQFVCWRCGFVPVLESIQKLASVSWPEAKKISIKYGEKERRYTRYERAPKEKDIEVHFPKGILDFFPKRHKEYLESRNFDAQRIIDIWDLRATGKRGKYSERIVAPITYRNKLMSYHARSIVPDLEPRYMACEQINERREHNYCLYGIDHAVGRSVLVLEGIADVWRMGIGSVAVFGISFTHTQVMMLYQNFENIFIMFDETEEQAQTRAKELAHTLSTMGKNAEHITLGIDHDPGDLSDADARYIMRDLLIR